MDHLEQPTRGAGVSTASDGGHHRPSNFSVVCAFLAVSAGVILLYLHYAPMLVSDELYFGQSAQRDRGNYRKQIAFGVVLLRDGHVSEAEVALQSAIKLNPNSVYAHYERGMARRAMGDEGTACREFQGCLSILGNNHDADAKSIAYWRREVGAQLAGCNPSRNGSGL